MNELIEIYKRIAPELMDVVEERYVLLNHISYSQPVGRRMLSGLSKLSERIVRSHVELMKDNGLVEFTQQGMVLSEEGKALLPKLGSALHELNKINELEVLIQQALQLDKVVITSGDGQTMLKQLGFTAAKELQDIMEAHDIIAVSGGSTMAAMADAMPQKKIQPTVIPARGGIGERVEYQANVIAAVLAEQLQGNYKMLHLPDGLSEDSLKVLLQMEPQIKEIEELSNETDILIFGIGQAMHMANQRHLSKELKDYLEQKQAVGEALGHYCTMDGDIVYASNNVGITLESIKDIPHVIAVAGGREKSMAIIGIMRACKKGMLIIDDKAAKGIAEILQLR